MQNEAAVIDVRIFINVVDAIGVEARRTTLDAVRGLLGEGAPLSAASLGRLKGAWQAEYAAWKRADLSERELVGTGGPTACT